MASFLMTKRARYVSLCEDFAIILAQALLSVIMYCICIALCLVPLQSRYITLLGFKGERPRGRHFSHHRPNKSRHTPIDTAPEDKRHHRVEFLLRLEGNGSIRLQNSAILLLELLLIAPRGSLEQ